MTFTINVPVFPMRKEVEARRTKGNAGPAAASGGRQRSRDAEGFLELELLPLDQLGRSDMSRPRPRKGLRSLFTACATRN